MLQVSIDHAEQVRSRLTPAAQHRSCKPPFSGTRDKANARISFCPLTNLFHRSVGASVIDYDDLVFMFILRLAQYIDECSKQFADISHFIQGWYDQGKTILATSGFHSGPRF